MKDNSPMAAQFLLSVSFLKLTKNNMKHSKVFTKSGAVYFVSERLREGVVDVKMWRDNGRGMSFIHAEAIPAETSPVKIGGRLHGVIGGVRQWRSTEILSIEPIGVVEFETAVY